MGAGFDFGVRVEAALHCFGKRLRLRGERDAQGQGEDEGKDAARGGGKKTHAREIHKFFAVSLCFSALESRRDRP
jgi:hypothetical protein